MALSPTAWARGAGAILGVGAVAAVLVTAAPDPARAVPEASVALALNRTATLGVDPVGTIIPATALHAGGGRAATVTLTNQGDRRTQVRLRIVPSAPDADTALAVELRAGGRRVFQGPLGALRTWTGTAIHLEPGTSTPLTVRLTAVATLPPATELAAGTLVLETLEQPWPR
jgi:hypothetical protein